MAPAPAPASSKKGLDFKHPGGKEALVAGGVALGLALLYFWWKNRQQQQGQGQGQGKGGPNSPTALLVSWMHDHQSSPGEGSGRPVVTVPNVIGKTDMAADAAITSAGLKVKDTNERKGGSGGTSKVTSQAPSGGTKVKPGSTVSITLGEPAKTGGGGGDSGGDK